MRDRFHALSVFVRSVDRLNEMLGRAVAWLTVLMVLVSCIILVMRYAADLGEVWLQESVLWMHGIVFLGAAGYTLQHNGHVRIDVFYRQRGARYRAYVDLFGALLLLLPMVLAIGWASWPYVVNSWSTQEASREAGGLAGVFLLKSVLLLFCATVALQGLALAARSLIALLPQPDNEKIKDHCV